MITFICLSRALSYGNEDCEFVIKVDGKKKTKKAKGSKKQGKDDLFKSLKTKIGITREEFDKSHKEFHNLCPNGQMTKEQFLEKSKETMAAGPMTGSLFRVFDEDDRSEVRI